MRRGCCWAESDVLLPSGPAYYKVYATMLFIVLPFLVPLDFLLSSEEYAS